MTGLQYTPYTVPLLLAAMTAAGLGIAIWNRRPGAGIIPFTVLMAAIVEWLLAYAVNLVSMDQEVKLIFTYIAYLGISIVPAAWFAFALEYTGREKWLNRRTLALLCIHPILVQIAVWTNPQHRLFWSTWEMFLHDGYMMLRTVVSPLFWVHAIYCYILIMSAIGMLVYAMVRSPGLYRGQTTFVLIGAFVPLVANVLTIFNLSPLPNLDITPFAFTIMGVMVAWSMARYRLLDIAPIGRDRVFNEMQDAVMIVDGQNRIVDINPMALQFIGLKSEKDAIGKRAAHVLTGFPELVAQYGTSEMVDTEVAIPSGTQTRHFQLTISPLINRDGTMPGRIFVLHEISNLKWAFNQIRKQNDLLTQTNRDLDIAQKEAQEASRLKTEFLATMSHELRTPLNAIIGFTDFMLMGMPGPLTDKQRDYLTRIISNSSHLLGLINNVLDVAKIEAARLELEDVAFQPADLLKDVEKQLRGLAEQKKLNFETSLDPNLPALMRGDPQRLAQILVNLISNAIRFTERGSVRVQIEQVTPALWCMEVVDTGIGIPEEALEFIFDEFRQVDGSVRREHGGTGLGLAIVRKLAKLMGGSVSVKSEVGKGSTFTVQLPIKLVEAAKGEVKG